MIRSIGRNGLRLNPISRTANELRPRLPVPLALPFVATANWGCLRLCLPYYYDVAMKAWAKRLLSQAWRETYVFFMRDDDGNGPMFAKRLMEEL